MYPQGARIRAFFWSVFILGSASLSSGCGGACEAVAKDRAMFEAREPAPPQTPPQTPHLVFDVPFKLLDRHVRTAIADLGSAAVTVPRIGRIKLRLSRVQLRPAPPGYVGMRLVFAVQRRGEPLFELTADTEIEPRIDAKYQRLVVQLGPQSIRRLSPKPSPGASRALVKLLRGALPRAVRRYTPKRLLKTLASEGLKLIVERGFDGLRDVLLSEVGAVSMTVELPRVPIQRVEISSQPERLRLAVYTRLPVRQGVRGMPPRPVGGAISGRISGATLAELVNHAMAKGQIPDRYSAKGKPVKEAGYRAALRWASGDPRRLVARLWKTHGQCLVAELEAVPQVRMARSKKGRPEVVLDAVDGRLVRVEGSLAVRVGAFLRSLSARAIQVGRRISAQIRLKVGGHPVRLQLERIALDGDDLVVRIRAR